MTRLLFMLAVALTLTATPALAGPDATTETCSTTSTAGSQAPSGSYVDRNGRTWTGFKADGMPPDSLSTSGETTTTCTKTTVEKKV